MRKVKFRGCGGEFGGVRGLVKGINKMILSIYDPKKREWFETDCPDAIRDHIRECRSSDIRAILVFDDGQEIAVRVNS